MPSVKLPKKSTDTDMTPFVDIAFLILSFFIMATKMKDPEKVQAEPPSSVGSNEVKAENSILITMDSTRVFFVANPPKGKEKEFRLKLIDALNANRTLSLTDKERDTYSKMDESVGVPLNKLKGYLSLPAEERKSVKEEGIPVKDSASNELYWWVDAATRAFAGETGVKFMIKGHKTAKYPLFAGVVDALKRNNQMKYLLVTSLESAPEGTDMYRTKQTAPKEAKPASGGSQ
jgi:biopolymer transport protein ExbD